MTLTITRTRDGVPYSKLIEFYAAAQDPTHVPFRVESDEMLALIEEIVEAREGKWEATLQGEITSLRADRVKLQGEIERLTHENVELREHLNHAGETLLDTATRRATENEALAQRLTDAEAMIVVHKDLLTRRRVDLDARVVEINARIDQVCDIIGARIGGLEERLVKLETDDLPQIAEALAEIRRLTLTPATLPFGVQPNPPGFPTGAATTVGDAIAQVEETGAESEPLKPQRGDRVRLEGAIAYYGHDTIPEGWYDVLGCDAVTSSFQIKAATGALRWVEAGAGLKEVRRGAAKLPE